MNPHEKVKRQVSAGKSSNSSTLSVRFDVSTEQIEESFLGDEGVFENTSSINSSHDDFEAVSSSSKLLHLPRLSKRSTSVDTAALIGQDSSPPSDPWKFLSEIKGKITKSVEDKITEIKARQEENSPKKSKLSKQRENSSFSDSEDISESSISKTCGIYSTTEGPEMSTEEDEEVGNVEKKKSKPSFKKIKLLQNRRKIREGYVNVNALRNIYEIATGLHVEHSDDSAEEVESAVDALEDGNLNSKKVLSSNNPKIEAVDQGDVKHSVNVESSEKVSVKSAEELLQKLEDVFHNISVDDADKSVCINEIAGSEIPSIVEYAKVVKTFFSPKGFVDMRPPRPKENFSLFGSNILILAAFFVGILSTFVFVWTVLPSSLVGFIGGVITSVSVILLISKVTGNSVLFKTSSIGIDDERGSKTTDQVEPILQISDVKEHKPFTKFEGWMNEYPDVYDPYTYHLSDTQTVYVKLEGNFLRISHIKTKIPKRSLWNQPKFKCSFTHHRIYNLYGAKIELLPEGLNKKRHWSKKYPICITLKDNQVKYLNTFENDDEKDEEGKDRKEKNRDKNGRMKPTKKKKKKPHQKPQIFSKLFEKDDFGTGGVSDEESLTQSDVDDRNSETAGDNNFSEIKSELSESHNESDGIGSFQDGWEITTPCNGSPTETCVFLFGRTCRDKENWFRRFLAAAQKKSQNESEKPTPDSTPSLEINAKNDFRELVPELEFLKYMSKYQLKKYESEEQVKELNEKRKNSKDKTPPEEETKESKDSVRKLSLNENLFWFNAFVGRIMYDVLTYNYVSESIKNLIQRKLSGIKLPYFIEELTLKDLYLGNESPIFHKVNQPYVDEKGLWIDLDMSYEGCFSIYVYTKLNLMKLKQPPLITEKSREKQCSAIYNSELEDSVETSSDEDTSYLVYNDQTSNIECLSASGGGGGSSGNTGKKIIKMVDKIAESKFFQKATENRFVKKAMEGVSNTDFGIKIELKHLNGVLALNIPPPPSDRLWYGFRPVPELSLSAYPIVGEKNITYIQVKNWIEKKLVIEFQKVLVIPNMDDLYLPFLEPLVTNKN